MYYVIERNYIGPNRHEDRYADADTIEISTTPARTNMSHEVRTEGWCGTTNDWAVYAHGEYETLEEAEEAIEEIFGDVREADDDGYDDDIVAVYKPGKYEQISMEGAELLFYEAYADDITADTTDERISELFDEYEEIGNREFGVTLPERFYGMLVERRDWLRSKQRESVESDDDEDED